MAPVLTLHEGGRVKRQREAAAIHAIVKAMRAQVVTLPQGDVRDELDRWAKRLSEWADEREPLPPKMGA
jgi:hypothetical protein